MCWFPVVTLQNGLPGRDKGSQALCLSGSKNNGVSHRSSCLCFLLVCRREELESSQAAWLSQAEEYENSHLGSYRRIYPACGTDKYEPFFKQSSSLFQETISSKAREECARYIAPAENPPLTGVEQRPLASDPFLGVTAVNSCKQAGESWKEESLHVLCCHGKAASLVRTSERQMQYSTDF